MIFRIKKERGFTSVLFLLINIKIYSIILICVKLIKV